MPSTVKKSIPIASCTSHLASIATRYEFSLSLSLTLALALVLALPAYALTLTLTLNFVVILGLINQVLQTHSSLHD